MRYVKLFAYEWLEGSIRKDLDSAGRGVWADMLALGGLSRRIGYLERSKGIPYTNEELAEKFGIDIELLEKVIKSCLFEGRLSREDSTNTLFIVNWDRYQDYPLGSGAEPRKADKKKTNVYTYNPAYTGKIKGTGRIPSNI